MQLKNKILIAYYSMTSHTRRVAELIQNAVGGELASIRTKETYPSDYEAMVEQGRREVNEGFLPVLNEFPVDIDACHMIFLGTPVWWYSIAPAMKSFLKNHDLRGKIIYPFVTNEGWAGHALQDFATNSFGRLCQIRNECKIFRRYLNYKRGADPELGKRSCERYFLKERGKKIMKILTVYFSKSGTYKSDCGNDS